MKSNNNSKHQIEAQTILVNTFSKKESENPIPCQVFVANNSGNKNK